MKDATVNSKHLFLVVGVADRCVHLVEELNRSGLRGRSVESPDDALDAIGQGGVAGVIAVEPEGSELDSSAGWMGDWIVAVRDRAIPILLVVSADGDWRTRARQADAWASSTASDAEVIFRAADLLELRLRVPDRTSGSDSSEFLSRLLGIIVHDLRTPLNVIGLTLRAIEQTNPNPSNELREDLGFLHDNARQIERLLAQLGEYCRLLEGGDNLSLVDFEPQTFFGDLSAEAAMRVGSDNSPVKLAIGPDCPAEVTLDPSRARLALQQAIANARTAAAGAPIQLRISGGGAKDRLQIEVEIDKPPPLNLQPISLSPDRFERLAGTAAERRGLDLAIAAWVTSRFGGAARLDVAPGKGTTLVFDWPARLSASRRQEVGSAR